jgi:hypothetical protein
VVGAWVRG